MPTPTMPVGGVRPTGGLERPADLVVRNAKVYTGDPARPAASAVAIRDGVFVAVGDDSAVVAHVGERTRIVDALGRRVIPGLNDSHSHVIRAGNNYLLELRWDGVRSLRQEKPARTLCGPIAFQITRRLIRSMAQ